MQKVSISKRVEKYLGEPYARLLIPNEEGGYTAEILEFPGCISEGRTADEAVQNLNQAAKSWVEASLEDGREIPSPASNYDHSGKIALRMPRSLHRHAAHRKRSIEHCERRFPNRLGRPKSKSLH